MVALICTAILAESMLLTYFTLQLAAYQRLSGEVNMRWAVPDPKVYVTPRDPAVRATVNAVTSGKVDPVKEEDMKLYMRMLFDWVSVNVKLRSDSPYPMLPSNPSGALSFVNEVWQYPNETLALRSGDCEDAAVLLLSMVEAFSPRLKAACLLVEGSKGAHAAVLVSKDGEAAILDPGLYYYTRDEIGRIAFRSLIEELVRWLPLVMERVGVDAQITALFSDTVLTRFKSTNEFIAYFHLHFKLWTD